MGTVPANTVNLMRQLVDTQAFGMRRHDTDWCPTGHLAEMVFEHVDEIAWPGRGGSTPPEQWLTSARCYSLALMLNRTLLSPSQGMG